MTESIDDPYYIFLCHGQMAIRDTAHQIKHIHSRRSPAIANNAPIPQKNTKITSVCLHSLREVQKPRKNTECLETPKRIWVCIVLDGD